MSFQEKSRRAKLGIIGSIILPLLYIIPLIISGNPDFIVFALGPFGFIVWIVQWISFFIGGWILAIITTILFFALVGYLLGRLIGLIADKITSKI
jgi:hypothetical protein